MIEETIDVPIKYPISKQNKKLETLLELLDFKYERIDDDKVTVKIEEKLIKTFSIGEIIVLAITVPLMVCILKVVFKRRYNRYKKKKEQQTKETPQEKEQKKVTITKEYKQNNCIG